MHIHNYIFRSIMEEAEGEIETDQNIGSKTNGQQ